MLFRSPSMRRGSKRAVSDEVVELTVKAGATVRVFDGDGGLRECSVGSEASKTETQQPLATGAGQDAPRRKSKRDRKASSTMGDRSSAPLSQSTSRWVQTTLLQPHRRSAEHETTDTAIAAPAGDNADPGAPLQPDGAKSVRAKGQERAEDPISPRACSDEVAGPAVKGEAQPDQCTPQGGAADSTVEVTERTKEQADVKSAESTTETEETTEGNVGQCTRGTSAAALEGRQRRTAQTAESAAQVEEPPEAKPGRQARGSGSAEATEKKRKSPRVGSGALANPEIGRAHV